jgi:transcriptional regulator with PAS, ATPase and Fis domain
MPKTPTMELIEMRDPEGRSIARIITDAYNQTADPRLAAKQVGVSVATLYQWMRELGIERVRRAEVSSSCSEAAA